MSDRIAWFISGACLSALLLTTTGFKTVPDGPGALGAAESFVTVMDMVDGRTNELLYSVPDGYVLSLTDWAVIRDSQFDLNIVHADSTVIDLVMYWDYHEILRTGAAIPPGSEIWAMNAAVSDAPFAFTGQLYRE